MSTRNLPAFSCSRARRGREVGVDHRRGTEPARLVVGLRVGSHPGTHAQRADTGELDPPAAVLKRQVLGQGELSMLRDDVCGCAGLVGEPDGRGGLLREASRDPALRWDCNTARAA